MAKSLSYRLFGVGRIPPQVLPQLELEGIVVSDEGVKSSVTYRDFKAPGKRFGWKRQWFPASIILTRTRLVAFWFSNPIINVPLSDERLKSMRFAIEDNDMHVSFDAGLFHSDWSGSLEYRLRTERAAQIIESLQQLVAERQ
jgi:hypothetical protein